MASFRDVDSNAFKEDPMPEMYEDPSPKKEKKSKKVESESNELNLDSLPAPKTTTQPVEVVDYSKSNITTRVIPNRKPPPQRVIPPDDDDARSVVSVASRKSRTSAVVRPPSVAPKTTEKPKVKEEQSFIEKHGTYVMVGLFILTIATGAGVYYHQNQKSANDGKGK
jgi:hypothetical protein